jgi:hypothetical protein
MSTSFNDSRCQTQSARKKFGICDDPSPSIRPAYIDEQNGANWIAVVVNEDRFNVIFTAVDHCINTLKSDGQMDNRCDGFLAFETTVIFVELKQRSGRNTTEWIKDGEVQLRATIGHFKDTAVANLYTTKKAYIANSSKPKFRASQAGRMEQFFTDTGYVLRIENRIVL